MAHRLVTMSLLFAGVLAAQDVILRESFTDAGSEARWQAVETPGVAREPGEAVRWRLDPSGKLNAIGLLSDAENAGNWGVGMRWDYHHAALKAVHAVGAEFPAAQGDESSWAWPDRDVLDLGRAALPMLEQAVAHESSIARSLDGAIITELIKELLPRMAPGPRDGLNEAGWVILQLALFEPAWIDDAARNAATDPGAMLILRAVRARKAAEFAVRLQQVTADWPADLTDPRTWDIATRELITGAGLAAYVALPYVACAEPALAPRIWWMRAEIRRRAARDMAARVDGGWPGQMDVALLRMFPDAIHEEVQATANPRATDAVAPRVALARADGAPHARDQAWSRAAKYAWLAALVRHRETSIERGYQPALGRNPENGGRSHDMQRGHDRRGAAVELALPLPVHAGASYELTYRVRVRNLEFSAGHPLARRLDWQSTWAELVPVDARGRPLRAEQHLSDREGRVAGVPHGATDNGWVEGTVRFAGVPPGVAAVKIRLIVTSLAGACEVLYDDFVLTRLNVALDEGFEQDLSAWRRVHDPGQGYSAFARAEIIHGSSLAGAGCARLHPAGGAVAIEYVRPLPLHNDRGYRLQAALAPGEAEMWLELLLPGHPAHVISPPAGGEWRLVDVQLDAALPRPVPPQARLRVVVRAPGKPAAFARLDSLRLIEGPLLAIAPGRVLAPGQSPSLTCRGGPAQGGDLAIVVHDMHGREVARTGCRMPGPEFDLSLPMKPGAAGWFEARAWIDGTSYSLPFVISPMAGDDGLTLQGVTAEGVLAGLGPGLTSMPDGHVAPPRGGAMIMLPTTSGRAPALEFTHGETWMSRFAAALDKYRDRAPAYQLGPHGDAGWSMPGTNAARALDQARETAAARRAAWIELLVPVDIASDPAATARAFSQRWSEALQQDSRVRGALSQADYDALLRQAPAVILLRTNEALNLYSDGRLLTERYSRWARCIGDFGAPLGGTPEEIRANAARLIAGQSYDLGDGRNAILTLDVPDARLLARVRLDAAAAGIRRVLAARTTGMLLDASAQPTPALAIWLALSNLLAGARAVDMRPWTGARLMRTRAGLIAAVGDTGGTFAAGHAAVVTDVFGTPTGEHADARGNLSVRGQELGAIITGLDEAWMATLDSLQLEGELESRLAWQQLRLNAVNHFADEIVLAVTPLPDANVPLRIKTGGGEWGMGLSPRPLRLAFGSNRAASTELLFRPQPTLELQGARPAFRVVLEHEGRIYETVRTTELPMTSAWSIELSEVREHEVVLRVRHANASHGRAVLDAGTPGQPATWQRRALAPGNETLVTLPRTNGPMRVTVTESPGEGFVCVTLDLAEK